MINFSFSFIHLQNILRDNSNAIFLFLFSSLCLFLFSRVYNMLDGGFFIGFIKWAPLKGNKDSSAGNFSNIMIQQQY